MWESRSTPTLESLIAFENSLQQLHFHQDIRIAPPRHGSRVLSSFEWLPQCFVHQLYIQGVPQTLEDLFKMI
jgi:hypothetical protein